MDEPIRSHLPNENYRRGWDETFGRVDEADPSSMVTIQTAEPNVAVVATYCVHGIFAGPCQICADPKLATLEALLSE